MEKCKDKNKCPLDGVCKMEGVVCKAKVNDGNVQRKIYVGCTEGTVKKMAKSKVIVQNRKS